MGVDTRAVTMIGKWFEDAATCAEYLLDQKIITEEEFDKIDEEGFDSSDFPLEYHDISCYSEEGGYLGLQIGTSIAIEDFDNTVKAVKTVLGDNIGLHNFVYWY